MMPRVDGPLLPLSPTDGNLPSAEGRQALFQRAMEGLVGQTVTAEVMSKLQDGSYLVKVADNAVRMMLPGDTQVGADVPLTVLAAQPRPTFQLGSNTPGTTATLVYAQGGNAAGGDAAAPLPSQDTPVYVPGRAPAGAGATPAQTGQAAAGTATSPASAGAGPASTPAAADAAAAAGKAAANAAASGAALADSLPADTARPTAAGQPAAATPATAGAAEADAAAVLSGRPGVAGNPAPAPAAGQAGATQVVAQPAGAQTAATGAAATPLPADAVRPGSLGATLLGKAPLTPASQLPELSQNTPAATLSNTARVLTTVLNASQSGLLALVGKTALFGNAAPDTAQLAQKLEDVIAKSGLFYESHVAEWAKGQRSLADLAAEPQMQRLAQQALGGDNAPAARAAAGNNGPDLSAAQMINQQLHTQEQGRVLWNGQAWPGQAMQWEVRRDERQGRRDDGSDGEPEKIWRSGVRFRFPMLGAVSASVTLVGAQVHIHVQTDRSDSADTLRAWSGRLEQAMQSAGAPLSSLTISQDSQEAGHAG